ncbi:hypothetical protein [Trichloromonas sp.]|uniref:hypothetical protein n=1 Tax=Trichloromonas sp. TaxID=3069249 RepID=UPI002A4A9117|nr:hypothetical protein [Trichloromonas sp.]
MKRLPLILLVAHPLIGLPFRPVLANSTQYGDIGLLSQPSAETLHVDNIGIGLWGDHV